MLPSHTSNNQLQHPVHFPLILIHRHPKARLHSRFCRECRFKLQISSRRMDHLHSTLIKATHLSSLHLSSTVNKKAFPMAMVQQAAILVLNNHWAIPNNLNRGNSKPRLWTRRMSMIQQDSIPMRTRLLGPDIMLKAGKIWREPSILSPYLGSKNQVRGLLRQAKPSLWSPIKDYRGQNTLLRLIQPQPNKLVKASSVLVLRINRRKCSSSLSTLRIHQLDRTQPNQINPSQVLDMGKRPILNMGPSLPVHINPTTPSHIPVNLEISPRLMSCNASSPLTTYKHSLSDILDASIPLFNM